MSFVNFGNVLILSNYIYIICHKPIFRCSFNKSVIGIKLCLGETLNVDLNNQIYSKIALAPATAGCFVRDFKI